MPQLKRYSNSIPRYAHKKASLEEILILSPNGVWVKAIHLDTVHTLVEEAYNFIVEGRVESARIILDRIKIYLQQTHTE